MNAVAMEADPVVRIYKGVTYGSAAVAVAIALLTALLH